MFGEDRLKHILKSNYLRSPKEISQAILDAVFRFEKPNTLSDDKTLVVIKHV
ncbi:MAG: serine/threonine-protein phosphatase [Bacteroidetes bacterium]|nr:serine/threonine-protein phosphatase [Bacteroidota bacterium]MBU1422688.1 serine/threonine-protein phosphatase [Bacteroidota bacterium]MBU2636541.1 serine/threonine-protein phosphatase [Bacteroidota bacterium]